MTHWATLIRFLLVGSLNTLVGLGIIYLAKWAFLTTDIVANLMGYGIGMTVSFILNRRWTFEHKGKILPSAVNFIFVQGIAYALNLMCVLGLIKYGVNSYIAQAVGVIPYTITSYLGSRYLVFKH